METLRLEKKVSGRDFEVKRDRLNKCLKKGKVCVLIVELIYIDMQTIKSGYLSFNQAFKKESKLQNSPKLQATSMKSLHALVKLNNLIQVTFNTIINY